MIYAPIQRLDDFLPNLSPLRNFLKHLSPKEEEGKIEIISDNVFAITSVYKTKKYDEAALESHRDYVDIQIVLEGEEKGKIVSVSGLSIAKDAPEKDLIIYSKPAKFAAEFELHEAVFAVFFDYDAHMTQLAVSDGISTVKKTVIKIKKSFL